MIAGSLSIPGLIMDGTAVFSRRVPLKMLARTVSFVDFQVIAAQRVITHLRIIYDDH
jgi:hypothetical protein